MKSDEVQIVLIAAAWSGGIGVIGLVLAWGLRRRSVLVLTTFVAIVAVAAVVPG
jgi:hypothetical protein